MLFFLKLHIILICFKILIEHLLKCIVFLKVPIPRFAVGIVIGRNGEMIKKIQNDAGVRIQFKPGRVPPWEST